MDWPLQGAKNRFSEVVQRARREGPQTVTLRGERAAVVLSAATTTRSPATVPRWWMIFFQVRTGTRDRRRHQCPSHAKPSGVAAPNVDLRFQNLVSEAMPRVGIVGWCDRCFADVSLSQEALTLKVRDHMRVASALR